MPENGTEREVVFIMALTKAQVREILSAAGVAAEKMDEAVNKIVDGHITSIEALREQRDAYKADAEKLPGVQKELDDLKAANQAGGDWEKKFNDKNTEFENFKAQVQKEKDTATKKNLYRGLLKELNIDEKRFDSILKVTDLEKIKLTKDGALDGVDDLKKNAQTEWADFVVTRGKKGADVPDPPANNGGGNNPPSRAAQLAAEYNARMYGTPKKEG